VTVWTDQTSASETWNIVDEGTRVFSPGVFSHGAFNGEYVFSMNPRGGVWDANTSAAETWTVQP